MERAYRNSTRLTSALVCALGIVMVASTLARGGGVLALGVVLGLLFALLGAGRFLLASNTASSARRR